MAEKPDWYRTPRPLIHSSSSQRPRTLYVRRQSPEEEATVMGTDMADPAVEPLSWHPLSWVADKATAAYDVVTAAGAAIARDVTAGLKDIANLTVGAATGEFPFPENAGYTDVLATAASRVYAALPTKVSKALGVPTPPEENAGWIEAGGKRYYLPKFKDPNAIGEKAATDRVTSALRPTTADPLEAAKLRLSQSALSAAADQWQQLFALQERDAAQRFEANALALDAARLALQRETASDAQRALWGRPSTISPTDTAPTRRIQAIGPGLASGIQYEPLKLSLSPFTGARATGAGTGGTLTRPLRF